MLPDDELLELNRRLLASITSGDWNAYAQLCHPDITCFEPEARGHLVSGLPFHKFYFDLGASPGPVNTTMASPIVLHMGPDAAAVCYTRLTQRLSSAGAPQTSRVEETRLWRREGGRWLHVHFHRSLAHDA